MFQEGAGDGAEILHVGAHDHGLAGCGGFNGALAAPGTETFADEDEVCFCGDAGQFTGGVDDQAAGMGA